MQNEKRRTKIFPHQGYERHTQTPFVNRGIYKFFSFLTWLIIENETCKLPHSKLESDARTFHKRQVRN